MSLRDALGADRDGEIETAAAEYERVLLSGERTLEVLLNLALLYWDATDPGTAAAAHFTAAFMSKAATRRAELLDEAERRFPESTEVRFWKRYIAWADLGEPFAFEECRRLLQEDPTNLVPALYLFSASQGAEARVEAEALLRERRDDGTAGSRYLVSVIESGLWGRSSGDPGD